MYITHLILDYGAIALRISPAYCAQMRFGNRWLLDGDVLPAAALREGFIHRAPPPFEEGYPKFMREKITLEGGVRCPSGDLRRVMLRTLQEERLFFAVVEHEEWVADDGSRGGRGISLDELVQNRRETLMRLAGAEVFENALEPPYETDVPDDSSQAGQNPDEDSPPQETPGAEAQQE